MNEIISLKCKHSNACLHTQETEKEGARKSEEIGAPVHRRAPSVLIRNQIGFVSLEHD